MQATCTQKFITRVCFARFSQILPAVIVLYFTASERKICVQKVISYKEKKLSQCRAKQKYELKMT